MLRGFGLGLVLFAATVHEHPDDKYRVDGDDGENGHANI